MIATQACNLQLRFSISDQNLHFIHIILQTFAYHISTVVPAKNCTIYFTLIDFPMNLLTMMNFGQFQLDAYESTHGCSSLTMKGECLDISG